MNTTCAKEWSRKFIRENFSNIFINTKFKEHLEDVLFNSEKALLPATQPFVEEIIRKEKLKKEINETHKLIEELYTKKSKLEYEYRRDPTISESYVKSASHFVRQCPVEGCRGFLSTQWKCGICEKWTCPECHELKGFTRDCDHKCDPNLVETAKLLNKDSKPCPKCQSLIFKISGCFAKNTPILMWNGAVKMSQDILIGDILVGDDGEERIVEDLVSGEDIMYEIKQNNGINYIVNSKHTLSLKFTGENTLHWIENINCWKIRWFDRIEHKMKTKQFKVTDICDKDAAKNNAKNFLEKLKLEEIILLTVDDYLKLDKWCKKYLFGYKSSYGINYKSQNVELDPYMLGLWLGDGTHTEPIIASNDDEIKDYILNWCNSNDAELIQETKYKLRIRRKGYSFGKEDINGEQYTNIPKFCDRSNPFTNLLKKYNLIGNKHIPNEYLMNSRENRLKLLAGLVDTDGHVSKDQKGKRVVIIQSNKLLSEQIINLASSLGFIVNYTIREKKNIKIFNCESKDYKNQYVINISGEKLNEIPTILPRKKCVGSSPNKDYFKTTIEVIPLGKDEYYGWSVDKNKRFLLSDYTVAKNCDQMWCTQCHTAFCWRTGAIESNIHNPHYYEWQRKNGGLARAAGDIECGRVLNSSIIRDIYELCKYHPNLIDHIKESCAFINGKKYVFTKEIDLLSVIIRQIIHNNAVELPRFQIDHFQKNQELRIRYLRKELTEESFKKIIQRNDKKNKKNTEIAQVIQLSITTSTDIIYRIVNDLKNSKSNNHHFNDLIAELNAVINYCNDIFKDISFTYNCVQYYFDEKFVIKTMEKKKENNEDSASKEFSEKV